MQDNASGSPIFLAKKMGGIILLILGLLLTVLGFAYGSNALGIVGILLLVGGVALLVLKIIRRNET